MTENNNKSTITLYIRERCDTCVDVKNAMVELEKLLSFRLVVINLDNMPKLGQAYPIVPVVEAGPYQLIPPFGLQDLEITIRAAQQRNLELLQAGDQTYIHRRERGGVFTKTDRASLWISKHFMVIINICLFLYVGLPFLAPYLMKLGAVGPAKMIYTVYSPLCHQLAFRSWFLFGEQSFYPRSLANLPDYKTYEDISGTGIVDIYYARNFNGTETIGYKVALCERDIALYGSMLFFGLIFSLTGNKLKSLKWYFWVIAGIGPMALDGISQLPSLVSDILPIWVPIRESTPLLRTITGFLFGCMTAWYLFPMIEESMVDTRNTLIRKSEIVRQISSKVG